MTRPDDYRVFYWAPDMSFCGFAVNRVLKKTGLTEPPSVQTKLD